MLSFIIWWPFCVGVVLLLLHRPNLVWLSKILAIIASALTLGVALKLYWWFDPANWQLQFAEVEMWMPQLGINYVLGVDGLSLPLVILTCFMSLLVVIFAVSTVKDKLTPYLALFLMMQGLMCGVFVAADAILFYVFFEAMMIPMFVLIGIWGGSNRIYATLKFILYTFFGSLFLLVAIIYLNTQSHSFMIMSFYGLPLSISAQQWLFWAILFSFAIKVPMWPVHTWLPDAHVEAPTGGSVILAAITLKMGGYGMLRFLLPIVPQACETFAPVVIALSLLAIAYIGFVALAQTDMKKLVAYSSVSHMGFVTLGMFSVFEIVKSANNVQDGVMALQGALIQMISHGFISGALFFGIGILYYRVKTRDINDFGGVANTMPVFASLMMLFCMANSGLPGTSGFIGEFLVIISAYKANFWYAFVAASTLILGASYTLWMYKRVMFGNVLRQAVASLEDVGGGEFVALSALAVMVLLFGIWPAPCLDIMHASITHLVEGIVQAKA